MYYPCFLYVKGEYLQRTGWERNGNGIEMGEKGE